jgi:hypothetical protein
VAVADVNGDGHPDIAVTNRGSNTVSVLLNRGKGRFKAARNFAVGGSPRSVAIADVNGDGRPDLVTANFEGANVSLLLGKPNAATHFEITAPVTVTQGVPFTITVTALTAGNQLDDLYTGTVTFGSSDLFAVRPVNYTFTKADAGSHTFTVILETSGSQTLSVTDTGKRAITGTAGVTVNPAGSAPPPAGGRSGRAATTSSASTDASRAAALAGLLADERLLAGAPVGPRAVGSANLPGGAAIPAIDLAVGTRTHAREVSMAFWTRAARRSSASDDPVVWGLTAADPTDFSWHFFA